MDPGQVSDSWECGAPYERYVGRWSRKVAPRFLAWLGIPGGRRWLDVGCGTGALAAAILERCSPSTVTGVEPSEGFLAAAAESLGDRATFCRGPATALPLGEAAVDAAVSGLVLNFVPDPRAAVREMVRVTTKGGTIGAYVWDYAGSMQALRHFWDAAIRLDPASMALDEGVRFPLCRPDALAAVFEEAGLDSVATGILDVPTWFTDFDDYWSPFLGGQGPAPAYVATLDEAARAQLRDELRSRLPLEADGSIRLLARAFAVRGVTPA